MPSLLNSLLSKTAGDTEISYAMQGELYASGSGWILLRVPNSLVRGVFDTMTETGIEVPPYNDQPGQLNAHISVIRKDELAAIGGAGKISERGHMFRYTLGPLRTCVPRGWEQMSRVWMIEVRSPELEQLRKSYGLSALPKNNELAFHISVAVRRKNVLRPNDTVKTSELLEDLVDYSQLYSVELKQAGEHCPHCNAMLERNEEGNCNSCGKAWPEKSATDWKAWSEGYLASFGPCPTCGAAVKSSSRDGTLLCESDHRYPRPEGHHYPEPEKSARYYTRQELIEAGKQVNTSPTPAQQESGNYQKAHVHMHGLEIAIENPKGSTRSGVSKDGKKWSTKMYQHYGYIKGTEGSDGDHVDVFIGDHPESQLAFVVDQVDPATGKFDEHKVMLGFHDEATAREAYLANYEDGWRGLGSIVGLTLTQFKTWLDGGDQGKRLHGQTIKLALSLMEQPAQPAYVRSLNTQLASPSWDASQGVVSNLMQNAGQWKDRTQKMVHDSAQAQQYQEFQQPDLAWQHLRDTLGGRSQPGPADPVDRFLSQGMT